MHFKFSIIGTGNMALFLAKKLCAAGHKFEGICGRNNTAAQKIATQYATTLYASSIEIKDEQNHFCFIAVKDNAISEIAAHLNFNQTVLIHTAGASSINLLHNSAKKYGTFWPIYSIVKTEEILPKNIPLAVEGNNKDTELLIIELSKTITDDVFLTTENQRLQLHLAAVFANNFSNHFIAIAEDICTQGNISFDCLKPLLKQTFNRLESQSAKKTQTGPAVRGDEETIIQHLRLLEGKSKIAELYQTISNSIRKMYENQAK